MTNAYYSYVKQEHFVVEKLSLLYPIKTIKPNAYWKSSIISTVWINF